MNWRLILTQVLHNIRGVFTRRVMLWLILALALLVGASTLITWAFERNSAGSAALREPADILWWAVAILFGLGDPSFFPETVGGKVVGVLLNIFDIVILSLFTTFLVSIVVDTIVKESRGMGETHFGKHVLLCGWNDTAREIVSQLHSDELTQKKLIVVLAENIEDSVADPLVHYLKGNPSLEADLSRAGVQQAETAVIFPVGDPAHSDANSLLVALAIETLNPDVYTIVQLVHARNREHFERFAVDEIFVLSELGSHLMARSVCHRGLAPFIAELLHDDAGNEFYCVSLPSSCIGVTFNDVMSLWRTRHKVILLAIQREGTMMVNPREDLVLQAGDQCLVIAWDTPRLD